jgi:hypothetical protein
MATKSHPLHRKSSIARKFRPGRRCWKFYWRIQKLLVELGFSYERK